MRHTRSHTKNRRSHHALKAPTLAVCANCGANHRQHHMCLSCGFYKGRQVMDLAKRKEEREARMQAKREAIRAQAETEPTRNDIPSQQPSESQEIKEKGTAPKDKRNDDGVIKQPGS